MSKVDRNAPKRSKASESKFSFYEFDREFPDDAACLEHLVRLLYPFGIHCPKCDKVTKHHRVKSRPAYSCQFCGHYEYPMVGTIFQDSATSLKLWFYAIHLMASTRCGISAKQLERELGVTYKTAWRMFNKIRSLVPQDGGGIFPIEKWGGTVEADEAYIGGRGMWRHGKQRSGRPRFDDPHKTPVFGMVQRGTYDRKTKTGQHGKVMAKVVSSAGDSVLLPHIAVKVLPASSVYTDEFNAYDPLTRMGYNHSRV